MKTPDTTNLNKVYVECSTVYNYNRSKRMWYNRSIKSWTLQHIDREGNQIGNAEYCHSRKSAIAWLKS